MSLFVCPLFLFLLFFQVFLAASAIRPEFIPNWSSMSESFRCTGRPLVKGESFGERGIVLEGLRVILVSDVRDVCVVIK